MRTVAENIDQLVLLHDSMAIALRKAKNGSIVEDAYFIEKLTNTALCLGYDLVIRQKRFVDLVDLNMER